MAAGFLQRERIIAPPGWSRWLIPPAALSIQLAIGQAYAWSVFRSPLSSRMREGNPAAGTWTALPFTLGIVMLGLSAAVFGTAVDRNGPRWAMFISAVCFSTGFLVSAFGVAIGQYWLVIVGYGLIGGIGLGIGYISPVSTLIKWFPDRPGMATGLAIMGFGGGAPIAAPRAHQLLETFADDPADAIAPAFVTLGAIYFVVMLLGAMTVRVPAEGWKPAGWTPEAQDERRMITKAN